MYKKQLFFLLVFFTSIGPLFAQISYTASFNQNKLTISTITGDDNVVYNRLIYNDEDIFYLEKEDDIGKPEVPIKSVVFSVPMDATEFTITLKEVESERIPLDYKLYPVQHPVPTLFPYTPPPFVGPDPIIYNSSDSYPNPNKKVEYIRQDFGGNIIHTVMIAIRPVLYYPTLNELELFTHLSFELNYSTSGSIAEKAGDTLPRLFPSVNSNDGGETRINCFLPTMLKEAHLCLFDIAGKPMKKMLLTERGNVMVAFNSQELGAGIYFCCLVADGKKVDSCKVIITH